MVFHYRNTPYPLHQLRNEMDRLFNGLMGKAVPMPWSGIGRGLPAINLWEEGDQLVAEMEVPGLTGEQLDVAVEGGELKVSVNYPEDATEGIVFHRRERARGNFERTVRLPADIDADRVDAKLSDGVLTITLPKAESAKPRKISVKTD